MAPKAERYWARRPMGYTDAESWEQGQVVELRGMANDEKLVRLGYVQPLKPTVETFTCAECGRAFIESGLRTRHGDRTHVPQRRPLTPLEEDERATQEEQLLDRVAPLHLEQTAASRR